MSLHGSLRRPLQPPRRCPSRKVLAGLPNRPSRKIGLRLHIAQLNEAPCRNCLQSFVLRGCGVVHIRYCPNSQNHRTVTRCRERRPSNSSGKVETPGPALGLKILVRVWVPRWGHHRSRLMWKYPTRGPIFAYADLLAPPLQIRGRDDRCCDRVAAMYANPFILPGSSESDEISTADPFS